MTNNTPSGAKKHHKNTEPESHQTTELSLLLHLLLSRWFSHKQQHFPMSSAPAHRFFPGLNLTRRLELLTEELWLHLRCHFSSGVHTCTNHLAMKCNYLCKIAELEIQLVHVQVVFEESLVWSMFFSQYCIGSL